jgi:hypothetical protein
VNKDAAAPSGYSATLQQTWVTAANQTAVSFALSNAEPGILCGWSIDDAGSPGGAPVIGSFTVVTGSDTVTGIDATGLDEGTLTLTVFLIDAAGNQGGDAIDTTVKDLSAPSGYSVTIDTLAIDETNDTNFGFSLTTTETGGTCAYTITDSAAGTVSGTVNVASGPSYSGIDVSGMANGALSLHVVLTDAAGNADPTGADAPTNAVKNSDHPPTPGGGGAVTLELGPPSHQVRVSFAAATDDITLQVNLEYLVVWSTTSGDLSPTPNPNGWMTWAPQVNISNLTADTTYYFNVWVRDEVGNIATYVEASITR